jgi:hypothetical protein
MGIALTLTTCGKSQSLPTLQKPDHLDLIDLDEHVRRTSNPSVVDAFYNFLLRHETGWVNWRDDYFGIFKNAFPYDELAAYDANGAELYCVGIDKDQMTMTCDIGGKFTQLRKKTTLEEHKELLDVFNAPAAANPDYPMKN